MGAFLQRTPALKVTILFVISILIVHALDWSLPEHGLHRVFGLLAAGVILFILVRHPVPAFSWLGMVFAVFLVALARYPSRHHPTHHLSNFSDLGRDVMVLGTVTDDPDHDSVKTRFTLAVDSIRLSRHIVIATEGNIQVSIKRPAVSSVSYGDRLEITGWLRRPRHERNPGEFDFERYLSYRGVFGLMSVRDAGRIRHYDGFFGNRFMRDVVLPIKQHVVDVCHRTLSPLGASVVIGLLVGERSEIPADVIQAFSLTGTIHILSLSGLHVVFISAILMAIFSFLHIPYGPRVVLTIGCIGLYVLIGDSVPPIVRAAFMTSVVLLGTLWQRRRNIVNSLLVALLVVLFIDPLSLFDIGLQLSFAAVLSIVLLYPRLEDFCRGRGWLSKEESGLKDRCIQLLLVSVAAQVGTMPFTAYYFYKIPLFSVVANLAVVPLSSAVMALGFLSSAVAPLSMTVAGWYAQINDLTVWLMVETASVASRLPLAYVDFYVMEAWTAVACYVVIAAGLAWRSLPVRKVALFGLLILLVVVSWWPVVAPPKSQMVFLDVGQGDCAFIRTASGKTMLIDGGDRHDEFDFGERTVAPFLRKQGIGRLDYVIMSHPHDDHIGGLAYILNHFDVGTVIESGQSYVSGTVADIKAAITRKAIPVQVVQAGDALAIDADHDVYFLHPTRAFVSTTGQAPFSTNNASLVLQMRFKNKKVLFMGDAELASLDRIQRFGTALASDIIKVGHHGSWNGTSPALVAAVRPVWAVMSVGSFNTFNHPSPAVEAMFQRAGTTVLRTDRLGAVIFETDGQTIQRVR